MCLCSKSSVYNGGSQSFQITLPGGLTTFFESGSCGRIDTCYDKYTFMENRYQQHPGL